MTIIYRYQLPYEGELILPKGAEVLLAGIQKEQIYIWARINPEETEEESRLFHIFNTGQGISNDLNLNFIGTVFFNEAEIVFHIFEQLK